MSILHSRKYFSIPESQRPVLSKSGVRLKLANGDLQATIGKAEFSITINGKCFQHILLIADIDTPAILGYDLLNRHNCKIDLGKGTITFGGTEIACQKESQMATIFKVTIDENVTLPPFSESIIRATIVGDSSHISDAIVEPEEPSTDTNFHVARSVVDLAMSEPPERSEVVRTNIITTNTEDPEKTYSILPHHLEGLFVASSRELSEEQRVQLEHLLIRHSDAFAKSKNDLGCCDLIEHTIDTVPFLVRTDHGALNWIMNFKNPEGQTARWLEILASYNFTIQHRPGRQHNNADGLSRRPCSPCTYCTRQESKNRENTEKDDIEHVRVAKGATKEPEIFDTEEVDIEDNTDSFEWVQSRSLVEIATAQQNDTILKQLREMKVKGYRKAQLGRYFFSKHNFESLLGPMEQDKIGKWCPV
ncbi:unnamed protein product [Mytilus edulis]|uniref:Uncharacterized protein n=1 Tax=Mytilus edulis TaxID=6550 RepID=A0A8S3QTR2_MYTED|nr:unnamed protein product [Mytilus edulis]